MTNPAGARRTRIPLLAVVLGIVSIVAACSTEQGERVEISFWAMGREGELVRELTDRFERENPGIRVRVQQIPWSAAHEKLLTAYAGDAMPDLFQLGNTWIPEFVALNALIPLGPRLDGSRVLDAGDWFSGILDTNVLQDRLYGLPWYVDTRLLFYRRDLFEAAGVTEAPRTWAQWAEAMRRVRAQETAGDFPILLPFDDWTPPIIFALQLGSPLLRDEDRYGGFSDPKFASAFDFYLSFFRQDWAPSTGRDRPNNVYQAFASGQVAMLITGPWNIGEFGVRLPESVQGAWATAPLPAADGEAPGVSIAGGASLVMSRSTAHPDAVWALMEFLTAPQQQVEFNRLTGDLPSSRTAWRMARLDEQAHTRAFWEQLQKVEALPKIPEWERIASRITRYSELVIRREMSPDAALAALNEDVDRILEKRRWLIDKRAAGPVAGLSAP